MRMLFVPQGEKFISKCAELNAVPVNGPYGIEYISDGGKGDVSVKGVMVVKDYYLALKVFAHLYGIPGRDACSVIVDTREEMERLLSLS